MSATKDKLNRIWEGSLNLVGGFVDAKAGGIANNAQNNQNIVDFETAKIEVLKQSTEASIRAKERADQMKTVLVYGVLIIAVLIIISTMSVKMKRIANFK
jgi:hypothetical protein